MKTKLVTLALLLMSAGAFAQTSADAEAIKTVCITETENFDKRDLSAILAGFADVPYASRYWMCPCRNQNRSARNVCQKLRQRQDFGVTECFESQQIQLVAC